MNDIYFQKSEAVNDLETRVELMTAAARRLQELETQLLQLSAEFEKLNGDKAAVTAELQKVRNFKDF